MGSNNNNSGERRDSNGLTANNNDNNDDGRSSSDISMPIRRRPSFLANGGSALSDSHVPPPSLGRSNAAPPSTGSSSSSGGGSGNGVATGNNNSAMALFDKYAKLNSSIEATRKEQQHLTKVLEQTRQQTDDLLDVRTEMTQQRQEALEELEEWHIKQKHIVSSQLPHVQQAHDTAQAQLAQAQREAKRLREHATESHDMFLESCVAFRNGAKRLKLQQDKCAVPLLLEGGDTNNKQGDETITFLKAQETYEALLQEQTDVTELMESLLVDTQQAQSRGQERQTRLEQGNVQLSRIRSDCWKLQDEIDTTRQQKAESEGMSMAFELGAYSVCM
jgi:hypothetical protein